jgi:hypothetical protein
VDALDVGRGQRLGHHPNRGHDARHRRLEAKLHLVLVRRGEQLVAVLGEQLLVGGDDVPAGAHGPQHVVESRVGPAQQLHDEVAALEDVVVVAPAPGQDP